MAKSAETIEVNGRECVRTPDASKRLNVSERRVIQFIEEKRLESIQLEPGGTHYIPIESLEALEKLERTPGRPAKKKASKKGKK